MKFLSSRDEYIHINITRVMNFGREESATPDAPFTGFSLVSVNHRGEPRKVLFTPSPGTNEVSLNIAQENEACCACQRGDILKEKDENCPPNTNFPIWIVRYEDYRKNVYVSNQLGQLMEAETPHADPMWCADLNHSQSE